MAKSGGKPAVSDKDADDVTSPNMDSKVRGRESGPTKMKGKGNDKTAGTRPKPTERRKSASQLKDEMGSYTDLMK